MNLLGYLKFMREGEPIVQCCPTSVMVQSFPQCGFVSGTDVENAEKQSGSFVVRNLANADFQGDRRKYPTLSYLNRLSL